MVYSLLLTTFLSLSAISLLLGSPTVFEVVDAPMAATALIGVFGLAFRIRMGRPDFWRVFLPSLLVWDIVYNFIVRELLGVASQPVEGAWWELFIGLALLMPVYAALLFYGYRSTAVWAGPTGSPGE